MTAKNWVKMLADYRKHHEELYARTMMEEPEKTTLRKIIPDKGVAIIMGDRRQGKSAMAHSIGEHVHNTSGRLVVLHLPAATKPIIQKIRKMVPPWMLITTDRAQWPKQCVVIYDEASQSAHARRSQSGDALELDNLIGISGQRDQLILFVSHHSSKLDKNIITDAGYILWKRPTYAHVLFERDELHDFVMKAFDFFQALKTDLQRKKTTLMMDFRTFHFCQFTNDLPSYWTDDLSKLFENIKSTGGKSVTMANFL